MFFFVEAQKLSHQPGNLRRIILGLGPINCPNTSLAQKLCCPQNIMHLLLGERKTMGVFATGSTILKGSYPQLLNSSCATWGLQLLCLDVLDTAEPQDLLTIQIQPLGRNCSVFPGPLKNPEPLRPMKSCNNFGEFMVFTYASKGSPSQKRNIMFFWGFHNPKVLPPSLPSFRIPLRPLLYGIQGQL